MIQWLKRLWTKSIRRQMILGITLVHAVLMTFFVTDLVMRQREFLHEQSVLNTESLALSLAANSSSWVLAHDVIGLEEVVTSQSSFPDLQYAMILAPDGEVLGHSDLALVGRYVSDEVSLTLAEKTAGLQHLVVDGQLVDIAAPILANDRLIGWARVAISREAINSGLRVISRDGVLYILLAILAGSIFAVLMARGITGGLRHLMDVAVRQQEGDAGARSALNRPDELGTLGTAFNAMIDAVADEKEQLRVTLYSLAEGVITTDTKGRIILVNPAAEKFLGCTLEEVAGEDFERVFKTMCDEKGTPCDSPVSLALAKGVLREADTDVFVRDHRGRLRAIAQTCAPIRDSHDQTVGVVLVFRDTTDDKKMRDQVFKAKSLESLGLLAGGIAHDFNNILTGILGNVNLATTYLEPGSEVVELLESAERATFRARDLTQQLLTFAKGGDPVRASHSLVEVLRETAAFVLSGSNVRCEFEFPDDLFPVHIDKGQISQVAQNIIINASQAMPAGGIVSIAAEDLIRGAKRPERLAAGDFVKLEISDTGIGIPKEFVRQIFDPYFTTKRKGSGLGLAVTLSIVEKHQGLLEVESVSGKGTKFTIYLPASTEPVATEEQVIPRSGPGQGTILVVDDEAPIRRALQRMLSAAGFKVILASEGEEAIEKFVAAQDSPSPFDVVITDLTIPGGIGGLEVATRILAKCPRTRLIVSSGYSNDPVMAQFASFGFSGVLTKPYTRDELLQVVHGVLDEAGPAE